MKNITHIFKGDKVIWMVVMLLSVISLLVVYSSTGTLAFKYQSGNTEYYLIKHFIVLLFGFGLMYATHNVKFTYYSRISQIAVIISALILVATLVLGTNINDASRWITLPGTGLTFQSSDLAKLALIMYVARLLSKKQDDIKDLKTGFLPILWPVLLICGLILPANFSTAAILFSTSIILMFIGRVKLRFIFGVAGIGIVSLAIFLLILSNSSNQGRLGTWKNRIENFRSGDSGDGNYQIEQSKIAIATGGVVGKLPGNSTQRNFLPHPYSDFIFAIIIEEYGLIGSSLIILLYLILLYRCTLIAMKIDSIFGALLAIGICFSLIFQAFINMAVAVNLLPVTGQPLPLISMGGTSIWFTSISIGIILSVSREVYTKEEETPVLESTSDTEQVNNE